MIHGVTHNEDGQPIQRLQITTKVAIGLGPDEKAKPPRKAPKKLDHFIFLKKIIDGKDIRWVPDDDLISHYGEKPTNIPIILLDDDLDSNVFPTQYAWWTASEKRCWGDGLAATRRTEDKPEGQPWTPCGRECPDLQEGRCKPNGTLHFVLEAFPKLGEVCKLHTTSYNSVRKIFSSLEQFQNVFGGKLSGLRCNLVVSPQQIQYKKKDGKKAKTTAHILNLEITPDKARDMRSLVASATEHQRMMVSTQKYLGAGARDVEYKVIETEAEQAAEIPEEYYPPERESAAPVAPAIQMPTEKAESTAPEEKPVAAGKGDMYGNVGPGSGILRSATGKKKEKKKWVEVVLERDKVKTTLYCFDNMTLTKPDETKAELFATLLHKDAIGLWCDFGTKTKTKDGREFHNIITVARIGVFEWLDDGTPVLRRD